MPNTQPVGEPVHVICDCGYSYIGIQPGTAETAARWHARETTHAVALYQEGMMIGLVEVD